MIIIIVIVAHAAQMLELSRTKQNGILVCIIKVSMSCHTYHKISTCHNIQVQYGKLSYHVINVMSYLNLSNCAFKMIHMDVYLYRSELQWYRCVKLQHVNNTLSGTNLLEV